MKLEELIKNFRLKPEERKLIIDGDNAKNENDKEQFVPASFKEIAKCILSGCFEIKEGDDIVRRVYPTCVEIYYHEESDEEDAIKDYIVYHRNNRNKIHKTPGTFKLGSFNAHQSGIDITFEHQDSNGNVVRASALIRGYKMKIKDEMEKGRYKDNSPLFVKDEDVDNRSTYLYEALFADLSIIKGFSIQWKDRDETIEMTEPTYRKNVLPYDKNTNEKNDGRCWQFSIKNKKNG